MTGEATSYPEKSLRTMENTQNDKGNIRDSIANTIASVSEEQASVLANVDLGAVIAGISNLHMYFKAMSSGAKAKQQQASVLPYTSCVTECGNPIGYSWQISTREQSTVLSRPCRESVQGECEHDHAMVLKFPAGLEGSQSKYELAYNKMDLRHENGSNDLRSEILFLRKSLCSLLLQSLAKPRSCERKGHQIVNALRDGEADLDAAGTEEEERNVHEHTTDEVSDPGTSHFPMTAGHLEIQAINEAVKEVSNAFLSLKNIMKDLPSQSSEDHRPIIHRNLECVSRGILRFPDRLTSLFLRRKAELDAIRKDRDAAAETLRAAEEKMASAKAKEMDLVAKTEAIDRDRSLTEQKMKKATEMLMAVEAREKLVGGRERRVESLEEVQALEELNHGANAALEDGADAAAAEAREVNHSTSPSIRLAAAVENDKFLTGPERISNAHSAIEHVLLGRNIGITAKEDELWHRENTLAFREINLHHREATLYAREQLLEHMKIAQINLVENWKAQVDTSYAGLEAEREDLRARFTALIALKGRVKEMQAKVRNLIGEARGVIGRGGENTGEDRSGIEDWISE